MNRDLIQLAERDGWSVSVTNRGHIRFRHPAASTVVFAASTPSCREQERAGHAEESHASGTEATEDHRSRGAAPAAEDAEAATQADRGRRHATSTTAPTVNAAGRAEDGAAEVAMSDEFGLPRCPGCCQPEHLCVCYLATCPHCGAAGRLLGPLEDPETEELCDACAGSLRFDRRHRPGWPA